MTHIQRDLDLDGVAQKAKSTNLDEAIRAVEILKEERTPEAIRELIELLKRYLGDYDKRSLVSSIIEALGKLRAKEAEEVLLQALNSKLYFIQAAAAEALGEVEPTEQAVNRIKQVIDQDPPKEVKQEAIRGLGKSRKSRAVEHLVDVIRSEPDRELKQEAVEAIGEARDSFPAYPLVAYYRREANDALKADIIVALSQIGSDGSTTLLLDALEDPNPEIRSCAAMALGEIGDLKARVPLENLLADPEEEVRKSAAKALGLLEYLPR